MITLGIIGSGNIGSAVARLAVAGDIPVVVANSRGPESFVGLIAELGALATAGTVDQAAQAARPRLRGRRLFESRRRRAVAQPGRLLRGRPAPRHAHAGYGAASPSSRLWSDCVTRAAPTPTDDLGTTGPSAHGVE